MKTAEVQWKQILAELPYVIQNATSRYLRKQMFLYFSLCMRVHRHMQVGSQYTIYISNI